MSETSLSPRAQRLRDSGHKLTHARLTVLRVLEEGGDLTDIKGIGAKTAIDIKKALRSRGFQLPEDE